MRYLIIDDEHIAHKIIMEYCEMLPHMKLQKNCYSALEALEYLNSHQVDLIFLDINMPKLKGFEFLKTLSAPPKVIVTTAYSEFAIEGYELNVSDYLLKPFSFERFLKAVNKVMGSNTKSKNNSSEEKDTATKRIFLRQNKSYIQVEVATILFIEAAGNYTKVVAEDETITIREKISDILESLPSDNFIQVHKSFAVAIKYINRIDGNRIYIQDHTIPIGKLYKANLINILN
ncbi:LytTR family DNA-binding domain-containing protein [Maribacter cobaltidurans]|uniref:LytTR family DNA-binding domain-containing protein n=1 Tax=Maribacter cobaltidurans TaxID=1178778 RepID=A0ABU7IS90_9FLAO|nr:LytTR family DNA-binding domain-containing protein [Maribacter cobaltidurans]MEE1975842.1 LytTR family DNA-binding domain-containing protein [Maribacter cobaltidurans]